jgi:spore germination protein YaaH
MRAALSRRAAAIATVLLFVGGGAASAGLAGVPGLGWAALALADASPSPSAGSVADSSPTAGGSPSSAPSGQPTAAPGPIIGSPTSPMSAHLSGDVYGYLPYWEMDSRIEASLDWNALSVISLFSVTQDSTGALDKTTAGWKAITSARGRRIAATAREHGVRVEITFTTFGNARNAAFFGSAAEQAATIAGLRALVADVGADGVNVDAELIAGTWFPAYGSFVGNLRAALRKDNPAATVSVATNGNTSGARMAKAAVDNGADRVFLMGYAYRSSGSVPGAIAPLQYRGSSTSLDLPGSLDLYAAQGVPNGRIILGLPFYGMTWPTTGPALGDPSTAGGRSFFPEHNLDKLAAASATLHYDPGESVTWFASQDAASGTWKQTFYDTPQSLVPKYQLAIDRQLAGIGVWALGYQRGLPGYLNLIESMFGPPKVLAVALPPRSRWLTVPVTVSAGPGSRPVTSVRLSNDGKTWAAPMPLPDLLDPARPGAPRPPVAWKLAAKGDGTYRVWVEVIDTGGTRSLPRSATVILDRTGPVIPAPPTIWWSGTSSSWRARWPAGVDPAGVSGYRVQLRVGTGPWQVATAFTTARSLIVPGIPRSEAITLEVKARDALGNWATTYVIARSAP